MRWKTQSVGCEKRSRTQDTVCYRPQTAILAHQQPTWIQSSCKHPLIVHATYSPLSFHGAAVWLAGASPLSTYLRLYEGPRGCRLSNSIAYELHSQCSEVWLWVWGQTGSPAFCGCVMLASVKTEETREREWVIKMQSELRGRERKNSTRRKVGRNLRTHPSRKGVEQEGLWHLRWKLLIPERGQRERKRQRWLCSVTPRSRTNRDLLMQMDRGRCTWWPTFFWGDSTYSENIASLQSLSVGGRAVGAGRYADCYLKRYVM